MGIRRKLRNATLRIYEERLARSLDRTKLPRHIGVIHDGHRRYARATGLADYTTSYRAGMDKFVDFLGWCAEFDIAHVTCWLLSKENLDRPAEELEPYFDVLADLFDRLPSLASEGTSFSVIGSTDLLPDRLRTSAAKLVNRTDGERRLITIGLAYGGRQEIVDAVRDLVGKLAADGVEADDLAGHIDASAIASHLYTAGMPDPDLVIRTSGESRLSGFLLWQAAYAEYAFVDVFWPAFRRVDFLRSLRDFTRRDRRFGR